ncbi:MAG: hypothetical protein ACRDD2_04745 [Sarcina sp.]
MRNSFKSLATMKFFSFILIIELTIALYLSSVCTITTNDAKQKKDNLERFFNFETSYLMELDIYQNGFDDYINDFSNMSKVYDEFYKMKSEGMIKDFYAIYGGGINPVATNDKSLIPKKYKNLAFSTLNMPLAMIMLNENFYNQYNLNISEGRGFTSKDFEVKGYEENVPIILGEDYKDLVSLGHTVEITVPNFDSAESEGVNLTFEVIGFYKHNDIPLLGQRIGVLSNIQYSNAFGIFPLITDVTALNYQPLLAQYGIFVDIGNKNNLSNVQERINNLINTDGYNLLVENFYNDYSKIKTSLDSDVFNSLIIAIIFTIFSILGFISVIIARLYNRKNEFAIKLSSGATIKNLIFEIIFENIFICLISTLLSITLVILNYGDYLSIKMIITNLSIALGIIIFINIISILKLKNLKIIDLLRRD